MAKEEIVTGLDIGTTKTSAVVARVSKEGVIEILGFGSSPTMGGLRKGVISNLENTVRAIEEAVEKAEEMADVKVKDMVANIGGIHLKSANSNGTRNTSKGNKEITKQDIKAVIDASCALTIPIDEEIIFVSPQEYIIDGHDGIKEPPVGLLGETLGVKVHLLMAKITSMHNIIKSINLAGLRFKRIIPGMLVSSISVLDKEETENGVMLVDIGGGTTEVAVYVKGALVHSNILGLGGDNVTNDIAIGLHSSIEVAEKVKKEFGCAYSPIAHEGNFEVPGLAGRESTTFSLLMLSEIIQARMEEIFELIKAELKKTGYEDLLSAGVVLTGGTANMTGIVELGQDILKIPVKMGLPRNVAITEEFKELADPSYSVSLGLLKYAQIKGYFLTSNTGVFEKMTRWVKDFF